MDLDRHRLVAELAAPFVLHNRLDRGAAGNGSMRGRVAKAAASVMGFAF